MYSLEPDAEEHCERFVTEALLVVPDSAEALQTLASIRISQNRIDDARAALERSIALWRNYSEPGLFGFRVVTFCSVNYVCPRVTHLPLLFFQDGCHSSSHGN